MPEFRRGRYQVTGAVFPQPGEDPGDIYEPTPEVPDIGIDRADPVFPHVVRALARLAMSGFDAKDPELIARAVEVGRAGLDHQRRQWAELSENMRETSLRDAAAHAQRRRQETEQYQLREEKRADRRALVYYMRIGDRCKIGYTTNLLERLRTINPEELMAIELGDPALERQRHAQFKKLRTHGEWFRMQEPLTSHVARVAEASRADIETIEHRSCRGSRDATCATGQDPV